MVTCNAKRQARFRARMKAQGRSSRAFLLTEKEAQVVSSVLFHLREEDPFKPHHLVLSRDGTLRDLRQYS